MTDVSSKEITEKQPRKKQMLFKSVATAVTVATFGLGISFAAHATFLYKPVDVDCDAAPQVREITEVGVDVLEVEAEGTPTAAPTNWVLDVVGHDHNANPGDPEDFDPECPIYVLKADTSGVAKIDKAEGVSKIWAGFSPGDATSPTVNPSWFAAVDPISGSKYVELSLLEAKYTPEAGLPTPPVGSGGWIKIVHTAISPPNDNASFDWDFRASPTGIIVDNATAPIKLSHHTHPDWKFTGKGTYTLKIKVSAVQATAAGSPTFSGLPITKTITFKVA